MRRLYMLIALLLVLSGGAGVLYNQGYWDDTWLDKKDAIKAEFLGQFGSSVPDEAREPFAECLSEQVASLTTELECSAPVEGSLLQQADDCIQAKGAQQQAAFTIVNCIQKVQQQLQDSVEEAP